MNSNSSPRTEIIEGKHAASGDSVLWTPVWHPEFAHSTIGLTKEGHWCVGSRPGVLMLPEDKMGFAWLLVLLEHEKQETIEGLTSGILNRGLVVELLDTFPMRELILFALNQADYWARLALGWLHRSLLDDKLRERLSVLIGEKKRYSQSTRQLAWRFIQQSTFL